MVLFQVGFKKTKRRVKKIRKREKPLKPEELLTDDSRSTDFGSRLYILLVLSELFSCPSALWSVWHDFWFDRSRGRGRRQVEEDDEMEDSSKDAGSSKADVLQQSDDIRTADMDISDDGENHKAEGGKKQFIFSVLV